MCNYLIAHAAIKSGILIAFKITMTSKTSALLVHKPD